MSIESKGILKTYSTLTKEEKNFVLDLFNTNNNPLISDNKIIQYFSLINSKYFFLYSNDKKLIGGVNINKILNNVFINFLYVKKDFIRMGFGNKLIEYVLNKYCQNNIYFELNTDNNRYKAQFNFYKEYGFIFNKHIGNSNILFLKEKSEHC